MKDFKVDNKIQRQINKKISESLQNYNNLLSFMSADIPLEALCLDRKTMTILSKNGISRVFDLINLDFTKIKGIGEIRRRYLTSRLDQFFPIR
mgnify:CR=1 FL=1